MTVVKIRERERDRSGSSVLVATVERLHALPGAGLITLGLGLLAGIGYVDVITGPDLSLGPAYQLPVFLAAIAGRRLSVAIAAGAAGLWTFVQVWQHPHPYSNPAIPAWNVGTRFLVLWLVAVLVSHLTMRFTQERHLSRHDFLTGLPNSRGFFETTRPDPTRTPESPLTIAIIDVDNFKTVNDLGGHAAGDRLLVAVGRTMTDAVGPHDVVARLGGDEFAVLLPATDKAQALQRLQLLHAELHQATSAIAPQVGFSIGAVFFTSAPQSSHELLDLPDRLMYVVKRRGKDLVLIESAENVERLLQSHADRPGPPREQRRATPASTA